MRNSIMLIAILLAVVTVMGCPGGVAPPFNPCGPVTATLDGRVGILNFRNRTVDVDESSTSSIKWIISNTDTGIDGIEATGSQTPGVGTSRTFTATGSNRLYTFTITGTITGPPLPGTPCTGNGTWQVRTVDGGVPEGSGSWTIP